VVPACPSAPAILLRRQLVEGLRNRRIHLR
jgi:hypothetical protein